MSGPGGARSGRRRCERAWRPAVRQELALQFDLEDLVEPLAGFVEVGEHPDGPVALLGGARELAHRVAAIAVDDKGQRTALRRLGRIPGEHQKLLEALHVGVAVRRRDIDDLAIMQGALLDGLPDGVLEFLGGDRSMSDGDDQAVVMGNANVNRHGLAPSIKQRLGEIQALDVRLDQRSYPGLPILAAAPAGCSGWGAGDGSFGCRPLRTRTTPAMAHACASARFMSSQWRTVPLSVTSPFLTSTSMPCESRPTSSARHSRSSRPISASEWR